MKKIYVAFYGLAAAFLATAVSSCSVKTILVRNPLDAERKDELVFLERSFLEQKFGKIEKGKFIAAGGNPCQFIDRDADGKWDQAVVLLSFAPHEKKKLSVSLSSSDGPVALSRAHVRHRRKNADNTFGPLLRADSIPAGQPATDFSKTPLPPFLTEGPAWENDKVGFRIYFDVRNGKDVWGKTTSKMMMDTVGVIPTENYHEQAPWGMDVLKVGASLGAGSLALSVPLNGRDTLVRLGGVNMGKVKFERLADGPLLGILRLTYPEWKVLEGYPPAALEEEIRIGAGTYFYESRVSVKNAPAGSKLVTGIVNLKSSDASLLKGEEGALALYTFDKQSENNDEMGMAIMLPAADFLSHGKTSNTEGDIRNTFTLSMRPLEDARFRFYAGWSKSNPAFSSASGFSGFLKNEMQVYSSPLTISWKH